MRQVIPLKDITRDDLEAVGEKAFELSRLETYDFKIPDGFCITSGVYMRYMMPLMSRVRKIDQFTRRAHILHAAEELRGHMNEIKLTPDTIASIKVAIRELSLGEPIAARPCVFFRGTGETVFTGKCSAFFDVTEDNVEEIIVKCWKSLFFEEVVLHKAHIDVENEDAEMAILMQRIVDGQSAGKMYTASPHNNDNGVIVIQAGYPTRHKVLFRDDYEEEYEIQKESFAIKKPKQDVRLQQVIEDEKLIALAKMSLEIENLFGQAKVVEWVIDKSGQIWVVQCGGITGWYPAHIEEAANSKKKKDKLYVYMGGVLGSNEVFSELGQSIIARISPVKIYHFGGRPYIDLQKYMMGTGCLSDMVFDFIKAYDCRTAESLRLILQTGALGDKKKRKKLPGPGRVVEFTMLEAKLKYETRHSDFSQAIATARERTEVFLLTAEEKIASCKTLYDKLTTLDEIISQAFSGVIKELFLMFCMGLGSLSSLREACESQAVDPDLASGLIGAAVKGVPNETIKSIESIFELFRENREEKRLEEIFDRNQEKNIFSHRTCEEAITWLQGRCGEEIAEACQNFFEKSGYWGIGLFDLRYDGWREKPTVIFEAIRENIKGSNVRMGSEKAQEAAGLLDGLVKKKNRKHIENIQFLLPIGFLPMYMAARLMHMVRPLIEEAGEDFEKNRKLLYDSRDITYLRIEEIIEAMKTGGSVAGRIMQRKKDRRQNRRLLPPPVMLTNGMIPEEMINQGDSAHQTQWKYLQGSGTAPGQAEGVARVVRDMNRVRLTPGEILVIPSMNMGLAPLALQAGGVVSECGGEMCVANILCIERSVPAVAGVAGCTDIIHSGELIRIDGRNGTVVKLERTERRQV